MIFDRLEHLKMYKGLNDNLDAMIDFVLSTDFARLVPGRNDILGDRCFLSNNVAELAPEKHVFERHMEYIDLQIPIDAGEIIAVRPVETLDWPDDDKETRFTEGSEGTRLDMAPGTFAVFFPWDAHNCGTGKDGITQVRKLVGKAHI